VQARIAQGEDHQVDREHHGQRYPVAVGHTVKAIFGQVDEKGLRADAPTTASLPISKAHRGRRAWPSLARRLGLPLVHGRDYQVIVSASVRQQASTPHLMSFTRGRVDAPLDNSTLEKAADQLPVPGDQHGGRADATLV
jgi:hypothetical protein